MYRSIVVAYNAGNEGRDALALASRLARPDHTRIVVVHPMPARVGWDVARETATRMAAARASIAEIVDAGLDYEYRPLLDRPFARSVHAAAAREDADAVVAGQSRLGPIARARVGGGVELLLSRARCPIVVAAPAQAQRAPFEAQVLGVGFDGSPESALALCSAAALARDLEARLRVVATGVSGFDACVAAERLAAGVPADVVTPGGDPVRALLGQAAYGVDALVVGHRARPAAQRASLPARLMSSAGCPLWVVPTDASGVVLRRRAAVA